MSQHDAPDSQAPSNAGFDEIELEIMDGGEEQARLLLVEASELQRRRTSRLIQEAKGHDVIPVSSASAARAALREESFDAVLASTEEGLDEIERLLGVVGEAYPGTPVILLAGATSYRGARALLSRGASACLMKPVGELQLMRCVDECLSRYRRPRSSSSMVRRSSHMGMVGNSGPMLKLRQRISQIAPYNITTLIEGPIGSGKELVARAIHQESGRPGPFITVDCGALAENILEAQLFGNEEGWPTGNNPAYRGLIRLAEGGTLFLDELASLEQKAQSRFLRALEQRRVRPLGATREEAVDIRVVASTNADLVDMVRKGHFRQDLLDRVSELRIQVPPLKDREGDLEPLTAHFADEAAREYRRGPVEVSVGALQKLGEYDWPGNVRELRGTVRTAVLLAEGTQLVESHLDLTPGATGRSRKLVDSFPHQESPPLRPAGAAEVAVPSAEAATNDGGSTPQERPTSIDVASNPNLPEALLKTKLEVISTYLAWAEEQATSRKEQAILLQVSLRTLHNYLRMVEEDPQQGES